MSQVAADPAMTLMKSRRRIASPKAWDYSDLAFDTEITAKIRERQKWVWSSVCRAVTPSRTVSLWVMNCRAYHRPSAASRPLITDTMVDCSRGRDGPKAAIPTVLRQCQMTGLQPVST
jgi:hypothetical protein